MAPNPLIRVWPTAGASWPRDDASEEAASPEMGRRRKWDASRCFSLVRSVNVRRWMARTNQETLAFASRKCDDSSAFDPPTVERGPGRVQPVSFSPESLNNPYQSPAGRQPYGQPAPSRELKHSGLGIASFAMGLVAGAAMLMLLVVAGVLEASTPGGMNPESTQAMLIGLGVFGLFGMAILGLVLGIVAAILSGRKKIFAVLGIAFNGLIILGLAGTIVLGLMMGG